MQRPACPTVRPLRPQGVLRHLTPVVTLLVTLGLALGCEADGGRAIGDTCAEDADCASGVCYQSVCLSATLDEDDDGLPNAIEARLTTDPKKSDTDEDGYDDLREVQDTTAPLDSDGDGVIDALESAIADADDDCLPDQFDPENTVQSAAARNLLSKTCGLGVCGRAPLSEQVAVGCEDGRLVCRRGDLGAPFVADEGPDAGCADGLDNDCDGVTDEGAVDTDGDEQPDCVDEDDDDDGTPDDEDCRPLDARCTTDCTDSDGDGEPDCRSLCPADPAQYPVACDDGIDCTTDTCTEETGCLHLPDDLLCDDLNPCTTDVCDPEAGCLHDPSGGACDDGEPCTVDDVCVEDACVPGEDVCACRVTADCAAEEDGDRCNGLLRCDTSAVPYTCVVDVATVIDCPPGADDDECRATQCQPATGACEQVAINEGGLCEDGNACTTGDRCADGLCVGESQCDCETNADCASLDDGNLCNGIWRCNTTSLPFRCEGPVSVVTCSTTGDTDCLRNECVPETGQCELLPANEGGTCEDGLTCTLDGTCTEGACTPGPAQDCDDGIACTTDSCAEGTGCVHTPDHTLCDDGNPCTANVCGAEGCTYPPDDSGTCDDGNDCTPDDHCAGGSCTGNSECECEGDDAECLPYEDDDLCNGTLICDQSTFPFTCTVDPATVVTCDTSEDTACRQNACDPATGTCALRNVNDDDPCDDGDPCTTSSFCLAGECMAGVDVCECRTDPDCADQEDGDRCNGTLYCDTSGVPYTCELDPATVITCDTTGDTTCRHTVCLPGSGACVAQNRNESLPCDDGDACTTGDTCLSGECTPGAPTDCDDDDPCTENTCDSQEGCLESPAPDDTPCSDGEPCTSGDACVGGICVPGGALDCDDQDPCTLDSCTPGVGCEHPPAPDDTPCVDADLCTAGDTCQSGVCTSGTAPTSCDDRVDCTVESCDPVLGCQNTPDPTRCHDLVDCTLDVCDPDNGCRFDPQNDACDDQVTCTVDTCVLREGCQNVPDSGLCDDGVTCTVDVCDSAADCQHTPDEGACDDGVACTDDVCDAALDCLHTENDARCPDEGSPCTDATCDAALGCDQVDTGVCVCQALVFGGAEEVTAGDSPDLSGGPGRSFTIEAWVNPVTSGGVQSLVTKALPGGAGGEWALLLSDGVLQFRFWPEGVSTPVVLSATATVSAGTWTHVAAVFDRTANSVKLYVNGSGAGAFGNILDMGDTAATVEVGPSLATGTAFVGSLDEVRVWSIPRAQPAIDAERDFPFPGGTAGLEARWAFDDVGTVTPLPAGAADFSGKGNALTFGTSVLPATGTGPALQGCP